MQDFSTEQAVLKIMETPEGRDLAYLCYYEWDVANAYRRFIKSEEWAALSALLKKYRPPLKRALDLGAGNGIGSYALSQSGFLVTSLEPDPSELTGYGAIQKFKNFEAVSIDSVSGYGENLPFKKDTFGLVYVRQALHHATDLGLTMSEISRVLAPGGILIATREHIIDDQKSLGIFLENHALHKYTHGEHAYMLEEYLRALNEADLKLEKLFLSWDSVINHYPATNKAVKEKFRKSLIDRYGRAGILFGYISPLEKAYRHSRSKDDLLPGRMISLVARANRK